GVGCAERVLDRNRIIAAIAQGESGQGEHVAGGAIDRGTVRDRVTIVLPLVREWATAGDGGAQADRPVNVIGRGRRLRENQRSLGAAVLIAEVVGHLGIREGITVDGDIIQSTVEVPIFEGSDAALPDPNSCGESRDYRPAGYRVADA